ncbi:hypothetical protein M407DRAFT_244243 [Tulasnella calospora MUT 4182]|uniref:Uncharacterized protein n=1 Tax=Tulasnella calospora MUT 4182 TaxID=1051891 RepID=A0A0C3QH11_9AGAM|nr:hypothetical protein M407DRAFT_244243 [Tulasnella calospora MUT 4182]
MAGNSCGEFLCPGDPLADTASIYVPILICFVTFSLAFGVFCRWLGIRRRRRLDTLEAIQWGEEGMIEPAVCYGEKPPTYEVSLHLANDAHLVWQNAMPLSVNPEPRFSADAQGTEEQVANDRESRSYADLPRRFTNLLLRRSRFLRNGAPSRAVQDSAHNALSVAFIIAMPGRSRDSSAGDGVLPELQLGFRGLDKQEPHRAETVSNW